MAEPQQYSLRWSNYFRQLTYALDTHRFNDEFVDVSLLCDGRKIKAHKVILSACSSYFKEILTENPHPHPLIIFKFIKYEDLNSIIKFMYQGEVNVQQDALQSFLQTAELLAVHGLNAEEKDKSQEPSAVLSEHDIIKSIPRTSTVRAVNVASLTTQNADIPFIQVKQNLASTSNTHQIATHQDNTTGGNTQQHHQVHTQNQEYPTTTLTVNKATPPVPSCSKGSKKRRVTFSGDGENSFYTIAHLGEQTLGKSDGMTFKESISMDIPEYVLGEVGNTLSDTGGTDENNQAAVSVAQNVSQYKSEYEILMESEIEEKYQPVDNSEIIIENRRLINQSFSDVQCPVKDTNLASNIGLTGNKDNSTVQISTMDSEIDMNLMRLLNECNLPHLYEFLLKQNIDIETLKMFKPHHASLLFKELPVGDYAKFEFKLEKWKKQFESTDNTQSTTALSSINTTFRDHQKISVMEILSSTSNGKEILNFYGKYDHLQEEQRALLVNTITKYIDLNGIPCSVSDCSEIEQQICTIFPTEQIEYYSTGKRGKIYNKLANYKRAAKNILKPDEPQQKENCIPEPEENYTFDLQCLRSKEISTSDLHHYWKRCAPLRFRQISNSMTTAEVFKLWPEYAEPSGHLLIDMDFVLKVPMATKFNERWPQYSEKLLHLMKSKISCSIVSKKLRQIKEINEESSIFTILWYCHYLFPPQQRTSVDETGAKFRKKFSMVDSQHSFALVAGSSEELEDKLSLLKQQGRSIKPKLLVVGEISNIKSIYVYFDGLRYPFLTVLNAVDTLFKIFFVFNLQFPDESEIFYNFIQIFFYDFPSNTKFVKSSAIKHEILKLT